jgi:hypothetical protein
MMNITKIAFALAALSVSTMAAAGITPAQIEAARGAGTLDQAWIAGASAPTRSIYEGWVKGCQAGTGSIFTAQAASNTSTAPGSLGNFFAYACTRGTRTSVLYHTVDGGSLNAFTPFTNGTKLARLSYFGGNATSCAKQATGYTDASNTANNADLYKGCAQSGAAVALDANGVQTSANRGINAAALTADALAPQQIVGGFSDVEPALFSAAIGGGNVSNFGTVSNAFLGQAFGVAVSNPLYRRLQQVQGLTESGTSFTPALAPSLTRGQIASILADGGAVQTAESWFPILGVEDDEKVIIQRRVDTSGSQASSNVFFLGNPCLGGSALLPATTTSGNYQVVLNSGSGNVKTNITTASNAAAGSRYAIGVLSLENDPTLENAANKDYHYIKIDGAHPETGDVVNARLGAASGAYPFHMEAKAFVANSAPAGFQRTIVTTIVNALKNPTSAACATLPRGLTLNPDGGNTSCVAGVVRAKFTNFGNNCAPAVLFE